MSAWNGSVTNRDIERPKARIDGHGGDFTPDPNWPSILELATQLWGKPTSRKSTEVRFGTNGGRKVWPQKNTWHDFESGEHGGYLELHRMATGSLPAADIKPQLKPPQQKAPGPHTRAVVPEKGETWEPIVPPPEDVPKPDLVGCIPYEYIGADGRLLFYQRRFEPKGRRKYFKPLTFGVLNGKRGWHDRGPGHPYPLFRLDRLTTADPGSTVLVVEGEKACMAAERLIPDFVVTTWLGGSGSVKHTDWSPLRRFKRVIWWADADKRDPKHPDTSTGGEKATAAFVELFPTATRLDTTGLADLKDGYDAADLARDECDNPDAWLEARLHQTAPQPDEADDGDVQLVSPTLTPISQIPPRQWAYGRFMLFGSAAVIGAMDGAGKGLIGVAIALAFITGKPLLGEKVWRTGPVVIISYEDDIDEWRRRFAAACIQHGLDFETVMLSIHFLTKRDGRVVLAQRTSNGLIYPDTTRIIHLIRSAGIALLIVDPFNNAHALEDGNNNVAIAAVAQEVSHIARASGVAALVLHHLRKGSIGSIDDLMGAVALRANFRSCRVLAQMTGEEAEQLSITEHWRYLRVAGTKENYAPPPDRAMWFQKVSLRLENPAGIYDLGDEVGAVIRWMPPSPFEGLGYTELHAVFDALRAPHSPTKQVKAIPWAGKPLMDLTGRTEAQAKRILNQWLRSGVLVRGEPVQTAHRHEAQTVTPDPAKVAAILGPLAAGRQPPNE
jgi:AAA domain